MLCTDLVLRTKLKRVADLGARTLPPPPCPRRTKFGRAEKSHGGWLRLLNEMKQQLTNKVDVVRFKGAAVVQMKMGRRERQRRRGRVRRVSAMVVQQLPLLGEEPAG